MSEAERKALFQEIDLPEKVITMTLRHRETGRYVIIGNVHVMWDNRLQPVVQAIQVSGLRYENRELQVRSGE